MVNCLMLNTYTEGLVSVNFESTESRKMVGLFTTSLQQAEPDLDLDHVVIGHHIPALHRLHCPGGVIIRCKF